MAINGSRNAAIFAAKILAQGSGRRCSPADRLHRGGQRLQMSRTLWVRWSFALPSGSAIRPSTTIGELQWPDPAVSVATGAGLLVR